MLPVCIMLVIRNCSSLRRALHVKFPSIVLIFRKSSRYRPHIPLAAENVTATYSVYTPTRLARGFVALAVQQTVLKIVFIFEWKDNFLMII